MYILQTCYLVITRLGLVYRLREPYHEADALESYCFKPMYFNNFSFEVTAFHNVASRAVPGA